MIRATLLACMMSLGSLVIRETSSIWNRSWTTRAMMILGLVESARDEALIEHRRWDPVVSCEPSFSIPWPGERLDVPTFGSLSPAMGIASRSRTPFPPAGISLKQDAALLVGFQSAPPSARVFFVDGFPWVIGAPFCGKQGWAVCVTEERCLLE